MRGSYIVRVHCIKIKKKNLYYQLNFSNLAERWYLYWSCQRQKSSVERQYGYRSKDNREKDHEAMHKQRSNDNKPALEDGGQKVHYVRSKRN